MLGRSHLVSRRLAEISGVFSFGCTSCSEIKLRLMLYGATWSPQRIDTTAAAAGRQAGRMTAVTDQCSRCLVPIVPKSSILSTPASDLIVRSHESMNGLCISRILMNIDEIFAATQLLSIDDRECTV